MQKVKGKRQKAIGKKVIGNLGCFFLAIMLALRGGQSENI